MASYTQWPDLLEEEAYLVQLISENPQESGTLEQATNTLNILRADLLSCTAEVAGLERDIQGNTTSSLSASSFFHRTPESLGSDHFQDEKERADAAQNERLYRAAVRQGTLKVEIKNFEVMTQMFQRRIRHHEELKQRLKALYDRVFKVSIPSSPEEEEAETEVRKAQQMLYQSQKTTEHHRTLVALLRCGDFALSAAGPRLSATVTREAKGTDPKTVQTDIIVPKNGVMLASVLVDQAKRLEPSLEQNKGGDFFRTDWLSSVFHTQVQGNSPTQHSSSVTSQQVLQKFHSALLSLLKVAREKYQVRETNLRHASRWYAEAYMRKQMLRRRYLLKYAGVKESELQPDSEGFGGGLARTWDLTAGLDKLITVGFPSKVSSPQSKVNEEKNASIQGERNLLKQDQPPGPSVDSFSPLSQAPPFGSTPAQTLVFSSSPRSKRIPMVQPKQQFSSEDPTKPPTMETGKEPTQSRVTVARNDIPISHIVTSAPATRQGGDHRPDDQHTPSAQSLTKIRAVPAEAPARVPSAQPTPINGVHTENTGPYTNHNQPPAKDSQNTLIIPDVQAVKRTGILKTPAAARSAGRATPLYPNPTVAQSPSEDPADAWGVKIASAGSSRPLPKFKKVIGMLRATDGFKPSNNADSHADIRSGYPRSSRPLEVVLAPSNLRSDTPSSLQRLRFSETVDLIPRPAVDSDPYENGDDSDECMPPSPKRGSLLWRTVREEEREQSDDSGDNHPERVSQPGAAQGVDLALRKWESTQATVKGLSAINILEELGFRTHAPAVAPGSGSGPSGAPNTPQETKVSPQSLDLNIPKAFAKQHSPQTPLKHMNNKGSALHNLISEWPRRNSAQAPRTYPDQSSAHRPPKRTFSNDAQADSHKLAVPDDTRYRYMSSSESNHITYPLVIPNKSVPPMNRGGSIVARSDHDLVQAIFPSPRSTVAGSDLSFTK